MRRLGCLGCLLYGAPGRLTSATAALLLRLALWRRRDFRSLSLLALRPAAGVAERRPAGGRCVLNRHRSQARRGVAARADRCGRRRRCRIRPARPTRTRHLAPRRATCTPRCDGHRRRGPRSRHRAVHHRRRRGKLDAAPFVAATIAVTATGRQGHHTGQRLVLPTRHGARVDRCHHGTRDRPAFPQHVLRHHRHATRHALVRVHDRAGAHRLPRPNRWVPAAVRRVDVVHVGGADAVVGHVDVARGQRHPSHRRAADVEADADVAAPDPGHQGRRVDRPCHVLARRPGPAALPGDPAAVVERCEAPRRVVDPGPAPGTHMRPVSIAVRRPARLDAARQPERTVLGMAVPVAVAVEVFGAGHLGRDVGAALHVAFVATVFTRHPVGKTVGRQLRPAVVRGTALGPELGALAGRELERAVARLEAHAADEHGAETAVVCLVDAVLADTLRIEAAHGRADRELAHRIRAAKPQGQAAPVQVQAHAVVIELDDLDLTVAVQAQGGRADLQFGAAVAFGREPVAAGNGPVALGRDPLVLFRIEGPEGPLRRGDAAHAARWVGPCVGAGEQRGAGQQQGCQGVEKCPRAAVRLQ